jgi:hypothetical protein
MKPARPIRRAAAIVTELAAVAALARTAEPAVLASAAGIGPVGVSRQSWAPTGSATRQHRPSSTPSSPASCPAGRSPSSRTGPRSAPSTRPHAGAGRQGAEDLQPRRPDGLPWPRNHHAQQAAQNRTCRAGDGDWRMACAGETLAGREELMAPRRRPAVTGRQAGR